MRLTMEIKLNDKAIEILEFYKKKLSAKDYNETLIKIVQMDIDYQESWEWKHQPYVEELENLIKWKPTKYI